MTILAISRRRRGNRLVITARGTLTVAQVPQLVSLERLPRDVERIELHLPGVRFDVDTLATLARLTAEARVPVHITPAEVRRAVEAAAEAAFAHEMALANGSGRIVGLCIVDAKGRIRFASTEATAALGLHPPLTNVFWKDVRPPGRDPVADAVRNRRLGQLRRADGWTLEALPLATGGAVISLIPPEEPAVAAEERNNALVEVAAAAAHEIRNPLAAIRAAIQLLQVKLADTPHTGTLDVVVTEIDKLARLLNHYLLLSRPTVRREVELAPIVESSLFVLQQDVRSDGVTVRRTFADTDVRVLADAEKLRQVFLNLLSNALDAVGGSGEIRVDLVREPGRNEVAVIVRDSGPGLPAPVLAAPFEAFRTGKPGASGLGLVIAHEIVAAHGGRLSLCNGPDGRGAEVAVTLPTVTLPG